MTRPEIILFRRMPGTGNAGNGGAADHDNVMMIGHVNDDPLLEDRAISLPLWGDMAGGENGSNEGNGAGAVTGKSFIHVLLVDDQNNLDFNRMTKL